MLARVWHVAGIALPGSRRLQYAAMGIGIAFAVALVGWGTWQDIGHLRQGDKDAYIAIASNLGDIVSFSAIAPHPVDGDRHARRRAGVAVGAGDAVERRLAALRHVVELRAAVGALGAHLRIVAEFFRGQGCIMAFAAGLAQRWAIRSASRT